MKPFILLFALLFTIGAASGQMTEKPKNGPFLLKGATIHPITSAPFVGDILIQGDRINAVSESVNTALPVTTINCRGKHIYPGFIDGGTHVGLGEIGSVSLTNDFNEIGDFIPQMQALTAVNPNSVSIPVTRVNGVTTVFTYPSGGNISGTGALIDLIGYTPEQMYAGFKGVVMSYPSSGKRGWWDRRKPDEVKKDYEKNLKRINDVWDEARLYARIDSAGNRPLTYNPAMEALVGVLRGEQKLLVEANKSSDIEAAIQWSKDQQIPIVLTGVREGHRVAKKIAEAGIPVITGPVLSMPSRSSDKYDAAYANAGVMMKAGVLVVLRTNETENVRNLPFNAGFAATYGMGVDEALKAITINPAKVFGVEKRYGSIEEGKVANLFVSDGDPFETRTQIEHLFIRGLKVPLESRHTLLYDEFLDRTPGLSPAAKQR